MGQQLQKSHFPKVTKLTVDLVPYDCEAPVLTYYPVLPSKEGLLEDDSRKYLKRRLPHSQSSRHSQDYDIKDACGHFVTVRDSEHCICWSFQKIKEKCAFRRLLNVSLLPLSCQQYRSARFNELRMTDFGCWSSYNFLLDIVHKFLKTS